MSGFRAALAFLTVCGGARPLDRRSLRSFGLVGALVGALVATTYGTAIQWWSPLLAATMAVAVDALVTGGLHLDGLADSADGVLPPVERQRRLEIMRTPDVGAFGVVAVVLVIALRIGSLSVGLPVATVIAGWAVGRASMVVALAAPPARPDGLAATFRPDGLSLAIALGAIAVAASVASMRDGALAAVAVIVGLAVGAAVLWLGQRRLGGHTGDLVGALGLLVETTIIVVASAR